MFDWAGRVILADAFSGVLDKLQAETRDAYTELGKLDDATVAPVKNATQQIKLLEAELARLRAAARNGTLTTGDLSQFKNTSAALQTLRADMAQVQGSGSLLTGMFGKLGGAAVAAGGAFAVIQAGRAAMELANIGAQAEALSTVYENLATSAGVSSDALISEMRRASAGTIAEVDMIRMANRALLAGGQDLANELPSLLRIARAAAIASGQDVAFVFDTLVKGIVKASPELIDNAEIYVKVGQAVDQYAQSLGKSSAELSQQERQVAVLNAVMGEGERFVQQMGLASETSADQVQSLTAATSDLRVALGELIVNAGAAEVIGKTAAVLRQAAGERGAEENLAQVAQRLREIGASDAATRLERQAQAVQLASYAAVLQTGNLALASDLYADSLNALASEQERYIALTSEESRWARAGSAERQAGIVATQQATAAEKAFSAALQETISKAGSVDALAGSLGGLAAQLQGIAIGVPEMPSLGDSALTTNTQALRDYLAELGRVNPELAPAIAQTENYIGALEMQQAAQVMAALSTGDASSALALLATEAFGAGSSVLDLVKRLDQLAPGAQTVALRLGLMTQAIIDLRNQANAPVSLEVNAGGFERGLAQIDQMALRLAKATNPEAARRWRQVAQQDLTTHWVTMGRLDEFGQALFLQGEEDGWRRYVQQFEDATGKQRQVLQSHAASMVNDAGAIRSQIEGALRVGLEVTPGDMAATDAGSYEDKALESARRLAAIAQRGFEELQVHPDWAAALQIPPDVLSGSQAQLQAWAAQTQEQVQNLARPDLINWDAFIENYRQGLVDAAAQERTLDVALSKVAEAGLLGAGGEDAARKKIAEMFGAAPALTFDALINPPETTPAQLANTWLTQNNVTAVPIPAAFAVQQAAGEAVPTGVAAAEGQLAPVPAMNASGLAQAGTDAAGALYASFETAVKAQGVATLTAGYWSADFAANVTQFQAIGSSMGKETAGAFATAVKQNVGNVRYEVAAVLAPAVAEILRINRGPLP